MKHETEAPRIGSDLATLEILRDLYFRDKQGEENEIGGTDLAILTYLLVKKAHDHNVFDAKGTIAQRLGISVNTLTRSLKRLEKNGYILTQLRGNTPTALYVDVDAIKPRQGARSEPSAAAIRLAQDHTNFLVSIAQHPRQKKRYETLGFIKQQRHSAQRLIDMADGNADYARDLIVFATDAAVFQKAASHSLYRLAYRFKDVRVEFEAKFQLVNAA